jgi:hypothetical protein
VKITVFFRNLGAFSIIKKGRGKYDGGFAFNDAAND